MNTHHGNSVGSAEWHIEQLEKENQHLRQSMISVIKALGLGGTGMLAVLDRDQVVARIEALREVERVARSYGNGRSPLFFDNDLRRALARLDSVGKVSENQD